MDPCMAFLQIKAVFMQRQKYNEIINYCIKTKAARMAVSSKVTAKKCNNFNTCMANPNPGIRTQRFSLT